MINLKRSTQAKLHTNCHKKLLWASIVFVILLCNQSEAQNDQLKGGKVGSGFSRFKESINAFRQKQQQQQQLQQQQIPIPTQTPIVQTKEVSSISKTQQVAIQAPIEQTNSIKQITEEQQTNVQSDSEPAVYGSVSGTPGVDFPALTSIPNTQFSCDGAPFDPGMYADESTGCQVYHLCYQGRRESFLCGVGTIFNQAILNCDFWHSTECSKSSQYYGLNADFGRSTSEGSSSALQVPSSKTGRISSSSVESFSKTRVVVQRPQPVLTSQIKSTSQQQVINTKVVQPIVAPAIKQVQQSEQFSSQISEGKISPPRKSSSSFGSSKSSSFFQTKGKTNFRRPTGILSPASRSRSLSSQQFASESSMSMFKVAKDDQQVQSAKITVEDVSTKESKPSSPETGTGPTTSNEIPREPVSRNDDWKPFFKSKLSTTTTTSSPRPPPPTETTSAETVNAVRADQEPNFSSNMDTTTSSPQNLASGGDSSPETHASIEPTVTSAVEVTSPTPATTESSPPTTEQPKEADSTTEAPTSPNPESSNPTEESSSSGSGDDSGVDLVADKVTTTTTTLAPQTTPQKQAQTSSIGVEYAITTTNAPTTEESATELVVTATTSSGEQRAKRLATNNKNSHKNKNGNKVDNKKRKKQNN